MAWFQSSVSAIRYKVVKEAEREDGLFKFRVFQSSVSAIRYKVEIFGQPFDASQVVSILSECN